MITQLFDPESSLNPEHRPKYIGLLAYACSVAETNKKVGISSKHRASIIPFLEFEKECDE